MERIVVGFDGSEQAHKALERAADISNGATLAVVCAANISRLLRIPPAALPRSTRRTQRCAPRRSRRLAHTSRVAA